MNAPTPNPAPRPAHWPHRADPPGRYWGNYQLYQSRGGQVRLEDDIRGLLGANRQAYGDISRFYFFCLAFDQMTKEGVIGDIAELGAYKGETASVLAIMARRMGTTAWILDTFEGFNPKDLTGIDAPHAQEFEDTSLEAVRALVGEENTRFIKGYFPDSAAQMPDDLRFALVHIDCDLYAPISAALRYFYPRLLPGGYLIIHDYACLAWDGAEAAVDEFFADKPEPVIPLTDGCGSAVIRKARAPAGNGNWIIQKRLSLFSGAYVSAGADGLRPLLGSGWSNTEDWGVWGIGASHEMQLPLGSVPGDDVTIEVDGAAALVGSHLERQIDAYVGDVLLTTWTFAAKENRAKRRVTIPASMIRAGDYGHPTIHLSFRPKVVARVVDLDPTRNDARELGLALFGLQLLA